MSYSFRQPEESAICECKYDEIRDQMDREDCPFHCNIIDDAADMEVLCTERKQPPLETLRVARTRRARTA